LTFSARRLADPLKYAMHNRFRLSSGACALALVAVLSACSTPKPLYQQEQFDATTSPYAHSFPAKAAATCEGARRALLSQGYITNSSRFDAIDGSKNFQPNGDSHVVIEFHVVCADADATGTASVAYVNAVQDRYALKKSNTSASVGLSVFGSLSLPIGSSDDAMVKIASETIPAGVFYERFFNLVDHFLKLDPGLRGSAAAKAAAKEPVAPLPEPAATPGESTMRLKAPAVAPTPASGVAAVPPPGAAPAPASGATAPPVAAPAKDNASAPTQTPSADSAQAASDTQAPAATPAPAAAQPASGTGVTK
jgi:hypothetical protein